MPADRRWHQADLQPGRHWQEWFRFKKGEYICNYILYFHKIKSTITSSCKLLLSWQYFGQCKHVTAYSQEACMACKLLQKRFGIKNVLTVFILFSLGFLVNQWQHRTEWGRKLWQVATWLKTTDSDNDGKLSFTEFSKAVSVDLLKLIDD